MEYVIYILLSLALAGILHNLSFVLSYKKFPNSYFEFGNYQIDEENIKNNFTVRNRIATYPDSIITEKRFYHSLIYSRIKMALYLLSSMIIIGISISKVGYLYAFKSFMMYTYVVIIIEYTIIAFFIRYLDAKETTYYMGAVYRALLNIKIFEEKNIETYAALPLGYTNLYFVGRNINKKDNLTRIYVDRTKKTVSLFANAKLKKKVRYFALSVIENTGFLQTFINDLTFVEDKIDLKSIFNDIYFSDKELIEIKDYIMDTSDGEVSIRFI